MPAFTNEQIVTGAVDVNNFPAIQAVTGPLTDAELRLTPIPVTIPTPVPVTQGGSPTATVTSVPVSPTVTTLSAANSAKVKVIVHNEGGTLYVKLGSGASNTSYSFRLTANTVVEIDGYTGIITGTKVSGATNALVTEVGI